MPSTSQPIPPAQLTNFPDTTRISGGAGSRELWYVCPISLRLSHPTPLQEFGIDIIGEDNKTTIHHKVAARVMCVFTDEDAHLAVHVEAIPTSASLPPDIQVNSRRAVTLAQNYELFNTFTTRSVPQNLPHFTQLLPPMRSQQASTTSAPTPASATPANPAPLHLPQSTLTFLLRARAMLTQVVAHSSQYATIFILLRA
ncbi:hypothetical protein DEU56DRAFT_918213 [Suillus clintonianus]|uniref:uncharacterized protein n=1 Tax=Suillus clintonianus TaxID=1904413 RepID=UPI001B85FC76|nr:uncharacterized protein DEU56DRAFT_918213 [Suillus clintonianus]KAG2121460.1 hypothetical protein DEU56DRAFT_918213 [Suillus clintonianus]